VTKRVVKWGSCRKEG